jgi:hypothetical protein
MTGDKIMATNEFFFFFFVGFRRCWHLKGGDWHESHWGINMQSFRKGFVEDAA